MGSQPKEAKATSQSPYLSLSKIQSLVKSGENIEELAYEHTLREIEKKLYSWGMKRDKHSKKTTIKGEYCKRRVELLIELFLYLKNNSFTLNP